jgi:ABC-type nitrate/sulfonate/bicarbonate transport system permease component
MRQQVVQILSAIAVLAVLLAAWELAVAYGYLRPYQYPPPSRIGRAFKEVTTRGFPSGITVWRHTATTVARIAQGYAAALAIAIPFGLLIGAFAVLRFSGRSCCLRPCRGFSPEPACRWAWASWSSSEPR